MAQISYNGRSAAGSRTPGHSDQILKNAGLIALVWTPSFSNNHCAVECSLWPLQSFNILKSFENGTDDLPWSLGRWSRTRADWILNNAGLTALFWTLFLSKNQCAVECSFWPLKFFNTLGSSEKTKKKALWPRGRWPCTRVICSNTLDTPIWPESDSLRSYMNRR